MSTPSAALVPHPMVVEKPMEGGAILMNMASGECFELNAVGRAVWERLKAAEPVDEIVRALAAAYAIPVEQAAADVRRLVDELLGHGILAAR